MKKVLFAGILFSCCTCTTAQITPVKRLPQTTSAVPAATNTDALKNMDEATIRINQLEGKVKELTKTITAMKPLLPAAYCQVSATNNEVYGTINYLYSSRFGFTSDVKATGGLVRLTFEKPMKNPVIIATSAMNTALTGKPSTHIIALNYTLAPDKSYVEIKQAYPNTTVNVMADFSVVVYDNE
jgi:hypothetical protein